MLTITYSRVMKQFMSQKILFIIIFLFNMYLFFFFSINLSGTMLTSAGLGVVFGLLLFALWWFTEWTKICLLFNSLLLGFLIGATLLFTPFGK